MSIRGVILFYPPKMLLRDIVAGNFAEFMNKIHNVHANDFFA